jgi:hypothetical protein
MTAATPHTFPSVQILRHAGSLRNVTTSVIMTDHFGSHLDQLSLYLKCNYDFKHKYTRAKHSLVCYLSAPSSIKRRVKGETLVKNKRRMI